MTADFAYSLPDHLKPTLPFMVIVIGQKCNLKCKNCSNFTSLMPQSFYSFDEQLSDLKRISWLANVSLLQIQGGEPFLWERLTDFIIEIRKMGFVNRIQIATNGTQKLPPALKALLLKDKLCSVRISPYPGVSDKLGNRLQSELVESGILVTKHQFANATGDWSDLGGIDFVELSNEEGITNFNECVFKQCLTLEDGVFARCSRGPTAHQIQLFKPFKGDLFEVRAAYEDELLFGKAYLDYVFRPRPMRACNFCNGTKGAPIVAGEQYKKKEWLVAKENVAARQYAQAL